MPAIQTWGIGKTYARREEAALWGVDLAVEPGSIRALLGQNGAGKTTLVRILIRSSPIGVRLPDVQS